MSTSTFQDKQLACRDCKATFIFSQAEQEFFATKQLVNEPKRCANCRLLLRAQKLGLSAEQTAEVGCHACGTMTRVPFQPNGHKPVLCNVCFHNLKSGQDDAVAVSRERPLAVVS